MRRPTTSSNPTAGRSRRARRRQPVSVIAPGRDVLNPSAIVESDPLTSVDTANCLKGLSPRECRVWYGLLVKADASRVQGHPRLVDLRSAKG